MIWYVLDYRIVLTIRLLINCPSMGPIPDLIRLSERRYLGSLGGLPRRDRSTSSRLTIHQSGVDKACTIYTYCADYELQAIERGLIGVTRPLI